MTRQEQEHRLRLHFENDVYYSSDDFLNSIQDGYDEIVAFSGCILKAVSTPFVNGLSYYDMLTLFPDYIGCIALFNSTTKRWLVPTSTRKLDAIQPDWETRVGTPEAFVPINHRYVAIYRKPIVNNYGNIYMFYRASAPTLSSNSSTIEIPEEHQGVLDDYGITDLWEQQQEFTKAGSHLADYVESLRQLHNWVHSQRLPGRLPGLK